MQTVAGVTLNEVADEVMVNLETLILESLYEAGVGVDEYEDFKSDLIKVLIDNLEDMIR